jgi:hypothetical protein
MFTEDRQILEDIDYYRHWHANSERYAGGDSLATLLVLGWQLTNHVLREIHWLGEGRQVHVLHIELERDGDRQNLPVLGGPLVDRLIMQASIPVIEVERPKVVRVKQPVGFRALEDPGLILVEEWVS